MGAPVRVDAAFLAAPQLSRRTITLHPDLPSKFKPDLVRLKFKEASMRFDRLLLILGCVLFSLSGFAQGPKACSPVGVWYGGSDYKYMLVITPIEDGEFAIRYEPVFANSSLGYATWTTWSGQLKKIRHNRYAGQVISMYTTSSVLPAPEGSYEIDAVAESVEFVDCNNIKARIHFFGAYFDQTKVPFLDQPDASYLPPEGSMLESYRRVPTKCTVCDSFHGPSGTPAFSDRRKR